MEWRRFDVGRSQLNVERRLQYVPYPFECGHQRPELPTQHLALGRHGECHATGWRIQGRAGRDPGKELPICKEVMNSKRKKGQRTYLVIKHVKSTLGVKRMESGCHGIYGIA